MTKSWYKSKEIWATVLTIIILGAKIFGVEANSQLLTELENAYLVIYPIIMGILRLFFTQTKLTP